MFCKEHGLDRLLKINVIFIPVNLSFTVVNDEPSQFSKEQYAQENQDGADKRGAQTFPDAVGTSDAEGGHSASEAAVSCCDPCQVGCARSCRSRVHWRGVLSNQRRGVMGAL